MNSVDELMKQYSGTYEVNPGFEDGVYSKIEKRKRLKKIGFSGAVGFILAVVVISVFLFFPGAASRDSQGERFANQINTKSDQVVEKQEVPVLEDVFFTLTDGEKNYAIEQVSISEEEGI